MLNFEVTRPNTKAYPRRVGAFAFDVLRPNRGFDDTVIDPAPICADYKTSAHEIEQGPKLKLQAPDHSLASLSVREYFGKRLERVLGMMTPNRKAMAQFFLDLNRFRMISALIGREAGEELVRIMEARPADIHLC